MGGRGSSSGVGGSGRGLAVNATMPTLTGSEKQTACANDIRGRALSAADSVVASAERAQASENESIKKYGFAATKSSLPTPASVKEARSEFVNALKEATSAKDFIDNRERFSAQRVEKLVIGRARAIDEQKKRKR